MTSLIPPFDWNQLLPARDLSLVANSVPDFHVGKTILVTGTGGSIGSALVHAIAAASPKLLILLDHSEQNLYEIEAALSSLCSAPRFLAVLGDAGDSSLLSALLKEHHPSLIYHAAAFKHVPLMEANPFAAIRNNALVTWNLARLAVEHNVAQLLLISTDKAASPRSIMGASKRLAELAILRSGSAHTSCRAIRLGNVLGSHGSVVPLFLRQIARKQNLTVTHKDVTRYFLTMDETVSLIFRVASLSVADGLFLPDMGEPLKIQSLAQRLLALTPSNDQQRLAIEFTGLRPGDKLTEDLFSPSESLAPTSLPGIHKISGTLPSAAKIDASFEAIAAHTRQRDLPSLLEAVREIIPEYQPSDALLDRVLSPLTKSSHHD
jgi:FlaA1/EpsC-like NDP-sugar epimerase